MDRELSLFRQLTDLEHLARTLNDRQHAGLTISPTMWSELYRRCNEARAVLDETRDDVEAVF
jgi:hypothetical protein